MHNKAGRDVTEAKYTSQLCYTYLVDKQLSSTANSVAAYIAFYWHQGFTGKGRPHAHVVFIQGKR